MKAKPLYHIVAAAGERAVIGKDNRLPWHFFADMKFFKQTTTGHTIIMGRKTFESLGKKPLPNRENFVLSRAVLEAPAGVKAFQSLDEALRAASSEKVFIIGGAELFRQTLDRIDGIYLTRIEKDFEGDTFYPPIPDAFKEKSREDREENGTQLHFIYLEKKQ